MYVSASSSKSLDAGLSFATFSRCVASARTAERTCSTSIRSAVGAAAAADAFAVEFFAFVARDDAFAARDVAGALAMATVCRLRTAALDESSTRVAHCDALDFFLSLGSTRRRGVDGEVFVCFIQWMV
tara:strand:- start:1431 stop:1814 length:384 start_codon:yes stop_codon:yes gene_type:complete